MVKFEYRKYQFVSNWREYYMLWLEFDGILLDILWQKPNISQVQNY